MPEHGKFGRAYEFDRNDSSDHYLQKFGSSVLLWWIITMVMIIGSMLLVRLGERWNLENRENAGGWRVTDAQLMECTLGLRLKLWSEKVSDQTLIWTWSKTSSSRSDLHLISDQGLKLWSQQKIKWPNVCQEMFNIFMIRPWSPTGCC